MKITPRAVLYVGFICNSRCKFCYYRHVDPAKKRWKPLEELKKEVSRFRYFYRLNTVDFMGGEPTIYPHILELISYCSKIGLKPTPITNAFILVDKNKCLEFKKSGVHQFLISLFGIGEKADDITDVKDTYKKQIQAFDNLRNIGIPFKINTTVHRLNYKDLPEMARLAVEKGAKVFNFMIFNPFYEWQKVSAIDFQEKYSVISPYIIKAIDILERKNIEANVRYAPICIFKGYEKNIYNFTNQSYDHGEWEFNSWGNFFLRNPDENWYFQDGLRRSRYESHYKKSEGCQKCSIHDICDGFHGQYVDQFGFGEEKPYSLEKNITDPKYFIRYQKKKIYNYSEPDKSVLRYLLEDKELPFEIIKNRLRYLHIKVTQNKFYDPKSFCDNSDI